MLLIVLSKHLKDLGAVIAIATIILWASIITLRGGAERNADDWIKKRLRTADQREQTINTHKLFAKIGIAFAVFAHAMVIYSMFNSH